MSGAGTRETPRSSATAVGGRTPTLARTPAASPWALALGAVGAALLLAAMFLPHHAIAAAAAARGAAPDLADGFLLLRFVLAALGALLIVSSWSGAGSMSIGLPRERRVAPSTAPPMHAYLMAGILMLAALLRLPALNVEYWLDEMLTVVDFIRRPFLFAATSFESQNNHPLYSLVGKAVVALLGESPAVLRLPSVAFGVASVGALYWFGTLVTSRREALLAAALLAVSYHHVWFSQNARAYTALLLLSLLGTGLFLRLCEERERGAHTDALLYAATMTLAVYAHLTAALVVVGHFLAWLAAVAASRRWREAPRSGALFAVTLAGMLSLVLYAPGLAHIAAGLGGAGEQVDMVWKNPLWMVGEAVQGLARGVPGGLPLLAVAAAAPIAGMISHAKRDPLLLALMILPALLTAAILIATGHNLWPRFFFFAAGFALLIVVRGVFVLAGLQRVVDPVRLATGIGIALVMGSALMLPRAWGPKQDFTGALEHVQRARTGDDVVAVTGVADWVYHEFIDTDWTSVTDADDLRALLGTGRRVLLVYAMPELIEARTPELWALIRTEFETPVGFAGTLAGGTVYTTSGRLSRD